jgi:hypothetical protein
MTRSGFPLLHAILEESPSEDDLVSSEGESSSSPLSRACNVVMHSTPNATTPSLEETSVFQTTPTSLSPKGHGPKAFGGVVHDTCFPRHFQAPGSITKYNGKTNPSVWLEDYRLACRAGRANYDLFII